MSVYTYCFTCLLLSTNPAEPGTVSCGRLMDPANGRIEYSSTTPLSVAVYICLSGFGITNGQTERVCQENGTWSGFDPVCEGQYPFTH